MNKKGHLIISFLFTIPFIIGNIAILFLGGYKISWMWLMIPKYVMMWFLFSLGPDMDLVFGLSHRNWRFHSLVIPVIFTLCFWGIKGTSFSILIWSVHLLLDIWQKPGKKPVGSYCIIFEPHFLWVYEKMYDNKNEKYSRRWLKVGRLTGKQTKQWLWINGITGLFIAIILDFVPTISELI